MGPRSGSDFDDLANDYRKAADYEHPSNYDPYWRERADEAKQAKLDRAKAKLRKTAGKGPSRAKAQREPQTSIAKVLSDRSRKNSRTKGNRGELDVAKAFSDWCGELVRRTPMSGGWSNARFGVTADLVCTKNAFPFHVEVKHREGWTLDDLVTGVRRDHDKSIVQWWMQCTDSCPNGKMPVLVFRRNRQPWLVMVAAVLATHVPGVVDVVMTDSDGINRKVSVMLLTTFLDNVSVPHGLKKHRRGS